MWRTCTYIAPRAMYCLVYLDLIDIGSPGQLDLKVVMIGHFFYLL